MAVRLSDPFVEFCDKCKTFGMVTHFVEPKKYMLSKCGHFWHGTADYLDSQTDKRKSFISDNDKKNVMRLLHI
jgi:hypothetical protein